MTVYAFDIDGTIETSNGPVTVARIQELRQDGDFVYLVSPSAARPKGLPILASGSRQDNLRAVKAMHPDEERFVYISDNGDIGDAQAAGFEYIWHSEF
ncbi:MAG: hypothetical protein ACREIE_02515 [Nitrospiraceae bacterium]